MPIADLERLKALDEGAFQLYLRRFEAQHASDIFIAEAQHRLPHHLARTARPYALIAIAMLCAVAGYLAYLGHGIRRLPDGHRKEVLRAIAEDVFARFEDHVLPFDSNAAIHYAEIVGIRDQLGLPIEGFGAQIAAICRAHGAALATRNVKDFEHAEVSLIDPWKHPVL